MHGRLAGENLHPALPQAHPRAQHGGVHHAGHADARAGGGAAHGGADRLQPQPRHQPRCGRRGSGAGGRRLEGCRSRQGRLLQSGGHHHVTHLTMLAPPAALLPALAPPRNGRALLLAAAEYYSKVTSTRNYEDRLATIEHVRQAGISVCAGGIIGLGEGQLDRVGLLHQVGAGAGGWGRGGGQLWGLHPGGEMGVSNQPASSSSNRSPSCFTVAPTHPPNHLLSPPAAARQSAGAALQWGDLRLAAAAAPAAAAPCAARPHQRQQQRHLWQQQQQRLGSSVLRECFGSRLRLLPIVFGSWHTAACPIL